MKETNPAEIVVDLLEIKSRSMQPFSVSEHESGVYDRAHVDYQYAAISHAVVLICEKYKVRSGDIDDELKKRLKNALAEKGEKRV